MLSTKARPRLCRCGAVVLEAIAEGVPVRANAAALNREGETEALLCGRRSYVLRRGELILRDATRLGIPGPVLADHRCGVPVPVAHRAPPPAVSARPPRPVDPPF